jgi:hypothetical protein
MKKDEGRLIDAVDASFFVNERRVNFICPSAALLDVDRTNEFVVRIFRLNLVNV